MTPLELDAAQRTIEADSSLMQAYQLTDTRVSISKRIEWVYYNFIKFNARIYQSYLRELERVSDAKENQS